MTTKVKILGIRNGVTKGSTLSGAPVFMNGESTTTPGQSQDIDETKQHGRMSKHYHMLKDKFHGSKI